MSREDSRNMDQFICTKCPAESTNPGRCPDQNCDGVMRNKKRRKRRK